MELFFFTMRLDYEDILKKSYMTVHDISSRFPIIFMMQNIQFYLESEMQPQSFKYRNLAAFDFTNVSTVHMKQEQLIFFFSSKSLYVTCISAKNI